jgi:hypothetical protein
MPWSVPSRSCAGSTKARPAPNRAAATGTNGTVDIPEKVTVPGLDKPPLLNFTDVNRTGPGALTGSVWDGKIVYDPNRALASSRLAMVLRNTATPAWLCSMDRSRHTRSIRWPCFTALEPAVGNR